MFADEKDWKGIASPRRLQARKAFELAVERVLGPQIRADGALAVEMWSALANVEWHDPQDRNVSYSFRAAAALVAWLWEDGDDLDWYCCGQPGVVSARIGQALAREGWAAIIKTP